MARRRATSAARLSRRRATDSASPPTLFDVGFVEPLEERCLQVETEPGSCAAGDKRDERRLRRLCVQLEQAVTELDRARLAAEVRDVAQGIVAEGVRRANGGGLTWREIGAELGVPFQTLYRRYGGGERK